MKRTGEDAAPEDKRREILLLAKKAVAGGSEVKEVRRMYGRGETNLWTEAHQVALMMLPSNRNAWR